MGRVLAEGFIDYWTKVAADGSDPQNSAGIIFRDTPKYVFSKTLAASRWDKTEIIGGELGPVIAELKSRPGRDIIAYGGCTFVASLIDTGLVDEYNLFLNPVVLGEGRRIFSPATRRKLKIVDTVLYDCGIVGLTLAPA